MNALIYLENIYQKRAMLNAEIPLAAQISICAEGWDWNSQNREAV